MKVKCIANTGLNLSTKSIEIGYTKQARFDLSVGEIYTVYSMLIFKEAIEYLISKGPLEKPFWYTAELFDIVDNQLSFQWFFVFRGYDHPEEVQDLSVAIWGYREMVFDDRHRLDLIEREPEALKVFFKRKQEMDELDI